MGKLLRVLKSLFIAVLVGVLSWYIFLPPLNLQSFGFIFWTCIIIATFGSCEYIQLLISDSKERKIKNVRKTGIISCIIISSIILIYFGLSFASTEMFVAKQYNMLLNVHEKEFTEDFKQMSNSQISVVDKDTAIRLGNRKFGEVVELVSQFNISDKYSQINYKNSTVRVGYLNYAGPFKWLANNAKGIPYFVKVDTSSQTVTLEKLENNMKYSPSEAFNRDLKRHVRFRFPFEILSDEYSFEIDDENNVYWVMPVFKYTIRYNGGKDVKGVILVNAVTGETEYFDIDKIPEWIDNAYPSSLLVKFADYWGKYKTGWWNSFIGQINVVKTTEGYNYLAINNDIWLYTGVTSATSDESNIGFILINKRTKETKYYSVNGAEEYSAMESAEGKVQEKGYRSTFPILLNIGDSPTYFVSLKDSAGLVKLYAYISVESYQIVGIGSTIEEAQLDYIRQLNTNGDFLISSGMETDGVIEEIITAIIDGNSNYYIKLKDDISYYLVSVKVNDMIPLIKVQDKVQINYFDSGKNDNEYDIKIVNSIKLVN